MVYIVKSKGHTVEMTRKFREAKDAFDDTPGNAQIFAVAFDGSAKLVKTK